MLNTRNIFLPAIALIVMLIAWAGWPHAEPDPIYSGFHSHSFSPVHEHSHSHDSNGSHGHQHNGNAGIKRHSHPHEHGHRHELEFEISSEKGLNEIGHSHSPNVTAHYWAKAQMFNNSVDLRFWTNRGQELFELHPDKFSASVLNGNEHICDVDFSLRGNTYFAPLPTHYQFFPSHILKLDGIKIDDVILDTRIPIDIQAGQTTAVDGGEE